ncbi:MAG: pyridoxal phosphate-dependent aminotransferase [Planctomycetes bacterium]|nr:pyridoxal phosphate-dependent aminotransferase [Planctomycetota bacterium]
MPSFFWKKLLVRTGIARWLPSTKRLLNGGESVLHQLSNRTLALPLQDLIDPAWFPDVQAPDVINLALGTPRCELILGALRGVNDRRALPAWGLPELRQELADRRTAEQGPRFDPADEILITHGASGAFATVIDTFVNPGDAVVLFDPTSPIFPLGLKHRRARIRWIDTWLEEGEGKTRFDIEAFASAMRGAKLLVLSDPVNPTGGILAPEDLEQIAWWAKKHDVLIHLDESFGHYRSEPEGARLAAMPHSENRLLIAGSVSKTYGLASARVGWLQGHRHLLRPCALSASMNAPYVSPLCQQIALTALRTGEMTARLIRDEFTGRRRYLFESLQGMGLQPSLPAGGYFFWVPVDKQGMTGREFARQLLLAQRVLVNPGEPFGPSGEDHIRLSYATEEGRLREGVQRLAEFMEELRKTRPMIAPAPEPEPTSTMG